MEENEGAIKLGRINRACEKALGLSLVSDVNVYMTGNGRNGINVYRFVNVVEPYVVLKNIKSAIEKSKGE